MKQERNQNRWTLLHNYENAEIKKASLKSPLKAKKNTQITFIKKDKSFFFFAFFFEFSWLFFGQSGLIRSPICVGFFFQDIFEALGLRLCIDKYYNSLQKTLNFLKNKPKSLDLPSKMQKKKLR